MGTFLSKIQLAVSNSVSALKLQVINGFLEIFITHINGSIIKIAKVQEGTISELMTNIHEHRQDLNSYTIGDWRTFYTVSEILTQTLDSFDSNGDPVWVTRHTIGQHP